MEKGNTGCSAETVYLQRVRRNFGFWHYGCGRRSKRNVLPLFSKQRGSNVHIGQSNVFRGQPIWNSQGEEWFEWSAKIRLLLTLNQSDVERNQINMQAVQILKDPHILAAAVAENRRVLTPLWLELLEEGKKDGSIKTEYIKELSELLPLINFWLMPSVFPATEEELLHKYHFVKEVLAHMGLPLYDDDTTTFTEKFITAITETPCGHTFKSEKADSNSEKEGNQLWRKNYLPKISRFLFKGSHICRDIVCCYNPDHSFVTAWRTGQTDGILWRLYLIWLPLCWAVYCMPCLDWNQ